TDETDALLPRLQAAGEVIARNLVQLRWTHGAEVLARLARRLGETTDDEQVGHLVSESAWETVDGAFSHLVVVDETGRLRMCSQEGQHENVIERYRDIALDESTPLTDAIRTGEEVVVRDLDAYRHRYPDLADDTMEVGLASTVSVPIDVDGQIVGG